MTIRHPRGKKTCCRSVFAALYLSQIYNLPL
uniref:Uncharacterized protein n=1 Tax=Rhizophora mucronata TaxID=61149 RepID=A0A2P2NVH8_RHIMU